MAKQIKNGIEARRALAKGADAVADTVRGTLGPGGRNVIISRSNQPPLITNDGASIAGEILPEEPFARMGAQLIQEASSKTNISAGDGTTTAVVLAQAMINEGLKNLQAGASPVGIRKGMAGAAAITVRELNRQARKVSGTEEIAHIAAISSGDEEIGKLLAPIIEKVTADGVITVEESKKPETTSSMAIGMNFERGFLSPYMATDKDSTEAVLENAYILVTDKRIAAAEDILPMLERFANTEKNLLIIADEYEGEARNLLIYNCIKGIIRAVCVRAPGYGDGRAEMLKDIAVVTGATVVSDEMGLELKTAGMHVLGRARRVRVTKDGTTIIGGGGKAQAIRDRVSLIRNQIELTHFDYDRKRFKERLARIVGGVAVIHVGAYTETEMREKKLRIEDAVQAARAAAAEGIVPGGGIALINAIPAVRRYMDQLEGDERTGAAIIIKALEEPASRIAVNAGWNGGYVVSSLKQREAEETGFDAVSGEFCNMYDRGIIDPVRMTRCALESAVSAAATALTAEALIADDMPLPNRAQGA